MLLESLQSHPIQDYMMHEFLIFFPGRPEPSRPWRRVPVTDWNKCCPTERGGVPPKLVSDFLIAELLVQWWWPFSPLAPNDLNEECAIYFGGRRGDRLGFHRELFRLHHVQQPAFHHGF